MCRRCALGEYTKASVPSSEHNAGEFLEWIDCDPQAPDPQQDLVQGAVPQVVGGPSTGTAETPGSGGSQVTGSGTQGTSISSVPGAGAQVTGEGTQGSTGNSTGAGAAGAGTELQDTSVGPVGSLSSVRDAGHSKEQ